MRKAWPYILFSGLLVYLIIVLTFAGTKLGEVTCQGLQVTVRDSAVNAFVDESDVARLIRQGYGEITGLSVARLDTDSIERLLVRNPIIKSAQVYYSLDGYIHVDITQRRPVFRVLAGNGFYVDEEGQMMPLSRRYTARVPVVTGKVTPEFAGEKLYPYILSLRNDKFWNALVEQVIVDDKEELVLIPKVGNFRIVLGSLDKQEEKMEKLRIFLKEGAGKRGWNIYKEINLKFDKQVVCVKR